MIRAKIILIACLLGLFISPAHSQCSGQPGSGLICGNDGSAIALPGWKTQTSILDRNFGAPSAQGSVLNRGASVWSATSTPILGLPGTTTGSLGFAGATSGTVTVKAQDAAGTWTWKWPTSGGSNGFTLTTDGSGNTSWSNPAAGGTVTSVGLALPGIFTVSGSPVTISGTLTGALATQAANLVWSGPTTGAATSPTFRSLVGADLPNPSSSTLGGVRSYAGVSSQWIRSISTSGVPASSQPAFSDISGALDPTQCPNPSATTIGCVESLAAVTSKWINQISTAGVPIATQPNFTDISGSTTLAQLPTMSNNTVFGNNSGGTAIPSALTGTQVLDFIGTTQGNVLYRNGTVWTVLPVGTNGQVLTSGGAAANPSWTTVTGTGTVTSVATNNGVTGGAITTTGTIGLASIAAGTVLANVTGGSTFPSSNTPSAILDIIGSTEGQILYRGASAWLALGPGTSGQVLQTQGAGATPQWANAGTVSSVATGQGLTGGTITTSGTLVTAAGVPTNTRLAKTANYSALSADCGSTIALGGSTYFTLTLSAASGYSATCNFIIQNEDTGRGKKIVVTGGTNFILWPGQQVTVLNQNNVWQRSTPPRWQTSAVTQFVDTAAGDDTGDCLASGSGACATSAQAMTNISQYMDIILGGSGGKIKWGCAAPPCTYTNLSFVAKGYVGAGVMTLEGDTTTPDNVVMSCTACNTGYIFGFINAVNQGNATGVWTVQGFKTTASQAGNFAIYIQGSNFNIRFASMDFAALTGAASHIGCAIQGQVIDAGNYTISGGAASFADIEDGCVAHFTTAVGTLSGTPVFTAGFLNAHGAGAIIGAVNTNFSGSASAGTKKYTCGLMALIDTGGTSGSLPGSVAGTPTAGLLSSDGCYVL